MMNEALTIIIIYIFAAISPGANFVIIVSNSFKSRKHGVMAALGVVSCTIVWIILSATSLKILEIKAKYLLDLLQVVGGMFLIYLGYLKIRQGFLENKLFENKIESKNDVFGAFLQGFIANILNPKSLMFWISIFGNFSHVENLFNIRLFSYILFLSLIYHVGLSFFFSSNIFYNKFSKYINLLFMISGIVLFLFGFFVLYGFLNKLF